MRYLFFIFASIAFALLMAFATAVRQPLVRLARAILFGLAVAVGLAGSAIGLTGLTNEAWWAVAVGAGLLLVALRIGWGLRRPRLRTADGHVKHVPLTRAEPDSHWGSFERDLDWVGRQQARRARTAIEGFIAERESPSISPQHQALLVSCERRGPELLDACRDRCRNASRHERDRYIDETLDRLVQIGREAERARREVREADDRRLQVLHRYFDGVAGGGEERGP